MTLPISVNDAWEIKLKAGKWMVKTTITKRGDRLEVKFPFNRLLLAEIQQFEGAKWHGHDEENPRKIWTIKDSQRNRFQLAYLAFPDPNDPRNPYKPYDGPLVEHTPTRECYGHQIDLIREGLTRHYCIWAAEMGTGKTLAAIEVMEASGFTDWLWVGPKSALRAVELEFRKWKCKISPRLVTYEGLKKLVTEWPKGKKSPQGVIFDESSRGKNLTSQRSQAMQHLADAIREEWGPIGFVIEMSGSPAPKSPVDWFSQCEIACVPKSTFVFTDKGPRQVKDLISQPCNVAIDYRIYKTEKGFFYTGKKELFEIVTNRGYKIQATADHPILCDFDGLHFWKRVKDIGVNDVLCLNNHQNLEWDGNGNWDEGYLVGWIIGDGTISTRTVNNIVTEISFYEDDQHLLNMICGLFPKWPNLLYNKGNRVRIQGQYLNELQKRFGLEDKKEINEFIETASSDFLSGFLSGFFDSDGSICIGKRRRKIILSQSNLKRLEVVQRLLMYFGIPCSIRKSGDSKIEEICGRKSNSKIKFELTITGEMVSIFNKRIGFQHQRKNEILKSYENRKWQRNNLETFTTKTLSITSIGFHDVFDVTVPEIQSFAANGFILHNCPGFIREGSVEKFKRRLAIIEQRESFEGGGVYPHLITWKDDENKCNICGMMKDAETHCEPQQEGSVDVFENDALCHVFVPSKNEVAYLYQRMKGLVTVKFKRDCLDLPDKIYREIVLKPSRSTLNAAAAIQAKAPSAIQALTLLRELSDGFQYIQTPTGTVVCEVCHGTKETDEPYDANDPDNFPDQAEIEAGRRFMDGAIIRMETRKGPCWTCNATGIVTSYSRETIQIPTPKEDALREIMDEHDDVGRLVVYGGFTGTLDRICTIVQRLQWDWIRIDGRGWASSIQGTDLELLEKFQGGQVEHPRIVIVGQPESAGMGLTLTASPTIVYYSNSFNGEGRIQSEDRIHRPGMDLQRGATIIDLLHLPSDLLILNSHKKKRKLQSLTMGQFSVALSQITADMERAL